MEADLPKEIPPEVEMKGISEKMEGLSCSSSAKATKGAGAGSSSESPSVGGGGDDKRLPIVMILVGMAGSGKTTLTQRLTAECMRRDGSPPYVINLDPACKDPPYPVNIDIRDTVKYKKVMEVYNLGPNGAIVTSLNLFATKFNQVLGLIMEKKKTHKYVIIDTPGQIEVFMWSASGSIITEALAALFPTVVVYVTDLVSNQNPITFISNMTYACSILYKMKLPLMITLNKRDLVDPSYAKDWITDFEAFQNVLRERDDYAANLASSLALGLEEFYNNIDYTVVSAQDGFGVEEFFKTVQKAVSDYEIVYRPMYEKLREERKQTEEKRKADQLKKLRKDLRDEPEEEEPSCFVRKGVDAGQGLTLRLDNEDDDTSSEEEVSPSEVNEEETFQELMSKEKNKRQVKVETPTTNGNDASKK